jgi:probable rRNA maturation factor
MKIQIENRQKRIKINKRSIRGQVTRLLKLIDCTHQEISITLVDDATIQRINRQYLHRDKPTNVISFSLQEGECGGVNPNVLGDIIISADRAWSDAVCGHFTIDEEILFLIIHGLLHLTGYDHVNTSRSNALKMQKKEKELFRLLTSPDGL